MPKHLDINKQSNGMPEPGNDNSSDISLSTVESHPMEGGANALPQDMALLSAAAAINSATCQELTLQGLSSEAASCVGIHLEEDAATAHNADQQSNVVQVRSKYSDFKWVHAGAPCRLSSRLRVLTCGMHAHSLFPHHVLIRCLSALHPARSQL